MAADVSANRHNNLQTRIERILGNGDGNYGYGQGEGYGSSPSSYAVSNDPLSNLNIVTAADINAIYSDMLRCRVHQQGTEPAEIAELIANANVIAESESFIVGNDGISVIDADGNKKGLIDFENLMTSVENDRFLLHPSQAALEPGNSSSRSTPWNTIIQHEFTVTFNDEDHRRHFFNAGGQIRISAALNNPAGDKALSWSNFFNTFGVVVFDYTSTKSSNTGSGTLIGNSDLTPSYQTVFTSTGSGYTNAVYNGNLYKIEAKSVDYVSPSNPGKTLRFRVTMNDVAVDNLIDDVINGNTSSEVQIYRANSQYVTVPAPTLTTNKSLVEGGIDVVVPPASYSMSPSSFALDEGDTQVITVSTENVTDGTVLYWTVSGTTNDFNAVSGSLIINSNSGSFSITAKNDLVTEGSEIYIVRLRTGSISGTVVDSAAIVVTEDPTYTITPSTLTIDEGSTGTFTVNTTSVSNGTQISWVTSAPSSDIPIGSGSFTINNNVGTFNITASADSLTEGTENYTVTLTVDGGTVVGTANITINDTSVTGAPEYILAPTGLTINEGSSGTFTVNTENVNDGTVLYWTVNGTTSDFNAISGSFTINSDTGSFSISPKADSLTEGTETYTVSIRTDSISGTVVDSTTFQVNDTSLTPTPEEPTYSLTGPSVVSEGSSGTYTLTTTGVGDGTTLYYTITNLTSENEDFVSTQGTFSVTSGTGSFNVQLVADETTEGAESFTVRVRTGGYSGTIVAETSTTIADTSTTPLPPEPTYAISYSPAGAPADTFNEGTTITALVTTTNVPGGTTLYWTINGTTADFNAVSGSFQVNFNAGQFGITTKNDLLTEGNENFVVSIRTGSVSGPVVASRVLNINDTSVTPPTTYSLSYSPAGTPADTFNEGSFVTGLVTTTNVSNNTTLYWTINATTADFNAVSGSFQINFNSGQFLIAPKADSLTEGNESYIVSIRTGSTSGPVVASRAFIVNDTSQTPAPTIFTYNFTTSENNANLRTSLLNAGWNGSDEVVATVNSGVYLYSNTTLAFGLSITGSYPNGVRLVNRGNIIGCGGAGANSTGLPGAGGTALAVGSSSVTIQNLGYIAGGGGGGSRNGYSGGGGGAGGGKGGDSTGWGSGRGYTGGAGGSIGSVGSNGQGYTTTQAGKGGGAGGGGGAGKDFNSSQGYGGSGGGGGRILPGVGGASGDPANTLWGGTGANTGEGGSAGNPGSPGAGAYGGENVAAGGGGWGARGGAASSAGGAGGAAIQSTTSYSLINSGTIYGTT